MPEKKQLSTGFVLAAGYAFKLRRTLLAQTRNLVNPREAIRVSAMINSHLFNIFREKGVDKQDVVRIRFVYTIIDGKIDVDWSSITIEHYKKALTIDKIPPPKHGLEEVVRNVRELAWDDNVFKNLKAEGEEIKTEGRKWIIRGKNWLAEAYEKERIIVTYTGTEGEFGDWLRKILGWKEEGE